MIFSILFVLPILLSQFSKNQGERIELWSFDQLESYISNTEDPPHPKIKVINFWATWCAPCIKELPHFDELSARFPDDLEVLLVSLDFSDELEKKVKPFVSKETISSKVVILTNENYNQWMGKIDSTWSGAIPATLFITQNGNRIFYEQEFGKEELLEVLNELSLKN